MLYLKTMDQMPEDEERESRGPQTSEEGEASMTRGEEEEEAEKGETSSSLLLRATEHASEPPAGLMDGSSERRAVICLKTLLLVILVASTVGVALMMYFYTSEAERSQFENRFEHEASTVLEAVKGGFYLSLGAIDAYVVDLVSYAKYSNSDWPFVALPDYGERAAKIRSLSKAFYFGQYHLVTNATREGWEEFSLLNDAWVNETLMVQQGDVNFHYHGEQTLPSQPYGRIHNNDGDATGPGPFLPAWQSYPTIPNEWSPYNWDGSSYSPMANSFEDIFEKRRVVARISNLPDEDDENAVNEARATNDWARDYIRETDDESEPIIDLYYPISTESLGTITQPSEPAPGSVVGLLNANMYWRELLHDILPPGTGGILAVFDVGGRVFTYAIEGPEATFLGRGDMHDTRFDHLEQSAQFLDLDHTTKGDRTYTGLPLSQETRSSTIRIYPSVQMEETFVSNDPIIYTVVAVLTFVFTSALFILYDRLRSATFEKVVHTAEESNANVMLLEERVKERTLELETANTKLEEANHRVVRASEAQLQHFACMSHEIRTPLNCVIGMSSLLMEETDLSPMQAESMQMISTSGELLLTIVNDVLDYSKLESGNIEIDVMRSNLQEALSSTVHAMNLKGATRNVRVVTIYDPAVPEYIFTDLRRLSQVLYNLLGNAMKFSKEGGIVEFSVLVRRVESESKTRTKRYSPPRKYQDEPLPLLKGNVIRFVVKDFGRGIDEKDFPKIFRPFRQADQATESLYGGTGLGLSITSKLVHGLGGSISVESIEGEWSTFTVDLPFNEAPADTKAIASALENATLLLVGCEKVTQERMVDISHHVKVNCMCFQSLQGVQSKFSADDGCLLSTERICVFVVNEDAYDPTTFALLSNQRRSILLTFGPRFKVKAARQHYRSLTQMLPSILLSDMARFVQTPGPEVTLPLPNISDASTPDLAAPYRTMRFLIAEDNTINVRVLSRILSRLGIVDIEVADNGAKAVELEASKPFDVVFMDMQMPVMSGVEATKIISSRQEEGTHPKAKVIFVTAQVHDHFEQTCLASGAVGFIAKPCTIRGIEECLQQVLSVVERENSA